MGITSETVTHTSDYFDHLYTLCVQLITSGHAYADDTEQMEMRRQRMEGEASARRAAVEWLPTSREGYLLPAGAGSVVLSPSALVLRKFVSTHGKDLGHLP